VTPAGLPVEDICRVEQVISALPEEVWQDPEMLLQIHRQLCRKSPFEHNENVTVIDVIQFNSFNISSQLQL
jgi:hypothetical protein